MSFISTKRRLGRVVGECDSDKPVGGVTLYGRVWLTQLENDDCSPLVPGSTETGTRRDRQSRPVNMHPGLYVCLASGRRRQGHHRVRTRRDGASDIKHSPSHVLFVLYLFILPFKSTRLKNEFGKWKMRPVRWANARRNVRSTGFNFGKGILGL
jgi:hypothetical protein